jgi:hypothetical protein
VIPNEEDLVRDIPEEFLEGISANSIIHKFNINYHGSK